MIKLFTVISESPEANRKTGSVVRRKL